MKTIASVAIKYNFFDKIEAGVELFQYATSAMDAIESVKSNLSGKSKKEWVLAFVESVAKGMGLFELWTKLVNAISDFIDKLKKLFNKE